MKLSSGDFSPSPIMIKITWNHFRDCWFPHSGHERLLLLLWWEYPSISFASLHLQHWNILFAGTGKVWTHILIQTFHQNVESQPHIPAGVCCVECVHPMCNPEIKKGVKIRKRVSTGMQQINRANDLERKKYVNRFFTPEEIKSILQEQLHKLVPWKLGKKKMLLFPHGT